MMGVDLLMRLESDWLSWDRASSVKLGGVPNDSQSTSTVGGKKRHGTYGARCNTHFPPFPQRKKKKKKKKCSPCEIGLGFLLQSFDGLQSTEVQAHLKRLAPPPPGDNDPPQGGGGHWRVCGWSMTGPWHACNRLSRSMPYILCAPPRHLLAPPEPT